VPQFPHPPFPVPKVYSLHAPEVECIGKGSDALPKRWPASGRSICWTSMRALAKLRDCLAASLMASPHEPALENIGVSG